MHAIKPPTSPWKHSLPVPLSDETEIKSVLIGQLAIRIHAPLMKTKCLFVIRREAVRVSDLRQEIQPVVQSANSPATPHIALEAHLLQTRPLHLICRWCNRRFLRSSRRTPSAIFHGRQESRRASKPPRNLSSISRISEILKLLPPLHIN